MIGGFVILIPQVSGLILTKFSAGKDDMVRSRVEQANVRAAALLTGIMGIVNILSGLTPAVTERMRVLELWSPLAVRHGSRLAATLAGFALLLLAGNLWRRKRVAWFLTIQLLIISIISHFLKGLDYEEAFLGIVVTGWLLFLHHHFQARSDLPSIKQGLRILQYSVLFVLGYGICGFYILDRHFSIDFGFWTAIRQTFIMFIQFDNPGLVPVTRFGRYFANSIYTISAITLAYSLIMLIRPVFVHQPATAEEREQARRIVESFGRTSLARFTLFNDKSYFFSTGGSLFAFMVKGRTALVLGDPIGPAYDVKPALMEFVKYCAANDWSPVLYQTTAAYLAIYRSLAFSSITIGQEAIVDLREFTLNGPAFKGVRNTCNRLGKLGLRAEMLEPPLSDELILQLRIISDEWLSLMHGREKGFALGWFDDDYVRQSRVMIIRSAEGAIDAFANIVPEYQRNEAAIDLMRRRRHVENGTMEYLFASLLLWGRDAGLDSISLGLSALAGVGAESAAPVPEKVLNYIYDHISNFYNFKGLHTFKSKFQPHWEPRYLVYPGNPSLPRALTALVRADSGDDFWRSWLSFPIKFK